MTDISLEKALARRRSVREFASSPVPLDALERLLWAAQGKTDETGLRTAPSAHALYPLRFFVTAAHVDGLAPGCYAVELVSGNLNLDRAGDPRPDLQKAAIDDQPWIGNAPCIVTICGDFGEANRHFADHQSDGQRGARYVHIEAGAAGQNLLLQVVAEGLGGVMVAGIDDAMTAAVLGLGSGIDPIMHLCIGRPA